MSLKHMPQWYQRAFGVLYLLSAAVGILYFATAPFSNPLTPVPALVSAVIFATVADVVRRGVADDGEEGGVRQTRLPEYPGGDN